MPVAFLVDGHLEKRFVQRLCSDAPVRMTNLNGKSVSIDAIVSKLETLMRLLKGRYYPIVIVVDREQRTDSAISIEAKLTGLLLAKGFNPNDFIVSCPDRMIENWIIAGTKLYQGGECDIVEAIGCVEGAHGKNEIKHYLGDRKIPYGETTVGVEMFCSMNFTLAAERSESYGRLHGKLATYCQKLRAQE